MDNKPQHTNYYSALLCSLTRVSAFLCPVSLSIFIVPLTVSFSRAGRQCLHASPGRGILTRVHIAWVPGSALLQMVHTALSSTCFHSQQLFAKRRELNKETISERLLLN